LKFDGSWLLARAPSPENKPIASIAETSSSQAGVLLIFMDFGFMVRNHSFTQRRVKPSAQPKFHGTVQSFQLPMLLILLQFFIMGDFAFFIL
jgi:hypothetical protein